MSLPFFNMYPTDFEADTSHLTLAEDGAYNRLLRLMWMTPGCSLPDDDSWIMRRMRCTSDEDRALVLVIIEEFFERENGRVSNARLAREFIKSDDAHKKRVSAGSKGGKTKCLKSNNKHSSNAQAMLKQPEPEPEPIKRDTKVSPRNVSKRGSRLPDNWALPQEFGEWAIKEGWSRDAILLESEKFKDYWCAVAGAKGVKLDWLMTWRNWMRNTNTPKLTAINGGQQNEKSTNNSTDRLRRVVTRAAAGTSGQDWG